MNNRELLAVYAVISFVSYFLPDKKGKKLNQTYISNCSEEAKWTTPNF